MKIHHLEAINEGKVLIDFSTPTRLLAMGWTARA
jgi:hypothetical protein